MYHSTVLIIGLTWPEPSATAAGLRMMQLIRSFLDNNFLVMVASAARKTALSADLSHLKIDEVPIRLNHSSFDIFIKKLQPGIVLFDRYLSEEQFGWRVAEYAPGALRILDTEDLHSLRASRQRALEEGRKFYLKNWLLSDITKREIGSIYRSDLSLIISDYELDLLQNIINIDPSLLLHLPFMQDPVNKRRQQNWLSFEERHHFIFIGNGKHAPNTDAILWLNKEIWPLIRKKLPEAQLHIYGSYLPGNITKLHRPEAGFFIYGWVRETEEVLERARVNLAPLRFGLACVICRNDR
jgi:hypothetical protein